VIPHTRTSPLGAFARHAVAGAIVISPVGKRRRDAYPPSRIIDLRLKSVKKAADFGQIVLSWTAPGDDFNVGRGKL